MSHIRALFKSMELKSDIFGTPRNPCIYNGIIFRTLAYLEPEASSKICRTCKMIMHIQSKHSQNSSFKHFQGCIGIFRNIDAYSATLTGVQPGGKGRSPLPFLNIEKSLLIFKRKALIVSIIGFNFPFKM